MNCRVVPNNAPSYCDVLANFAVVSNHALINDALFPHFRIISNDRRVRNATSEVPTYIIGHVFVKNLLLINQLVGVLRSMEDDVVHHKRIAFACDYV